MNRMMLVLFFLFATLGIAQTPKEVLLKGGYIPFTSGDASPILPGEIFRVEYLPTDNFGRPGQARALLTHMKTRRSVEVFPTLASNRVIAVVIGVTEEFPTGTYELRVELVDQAVRVTQLPRVTFHISMADPREFLPRRPMAISQQRVSPQQFILKGFFPVNYDFLATSVWVADQNGIIGSFDRRDNLWPGSSVSREDAFTDWWPPIALKAGFRTTLVWTDGGVSYATTSRVIDPAPSQFELSVVE